MLRLEKLEIAGFKSFYEKAELTFPGAVTAVVGPNGCGKSNICDAVAWALGEQSARILRGERMDDVIFNGSGKRRSLGMAEVTLTLQSSNGEFPETEGRIAIGRRVYREGEGEYFLNGRRVRLKDVQDVLFGTGLGVRAYAIIEQGKIDQVLSSKPQDRRKLIEEAAGITRYKIKKRAAEMKLEETRANLTRLSDIVAEVERNCASLKRQASRAERYKERTGRLRGLRAALARLRFDELSAQASGAAGDLQARRDEESSAASALAAAEAGEAEARRVALDARAVRDAARDRLTELTSAVERDDAAIEAARRAEVEIAARRDALARDSSELEAESSRRAAARAGLAASRTEQESELSALRREQEALAAGKIELEARLAELEAAQDRHREALTSASGRRIEMRNARHEIELAIERVDSARGRIRDSRARLADALAALSSEIAALEQDDAGLRGQSEAARGRAQNNARTLSELGARLEELEQERGRRREELAAIEHRVQVLSEIREARGRSAEGAIALFRKEGVETRGLLSGLLRPRPGWEEVLDRLLAEELPAVLVESEPAAAAARLRQSGLGATVAGTRWPDGPAASDWTRVLENLEELPAAVRAALPPARFVESAEEAREVSRRSPGELVAARTGEIVRGPLWRIPVPRTENEGPLSLRRDLARARADRDRLEREVEECEARLSQVRAGKAEAEAEAAEIAGQLHAADAAGAGLAARLSERGEDRRRKEQEVETLQVEDAMLAEEGDKHASRCRELLEAEAALEAEERQVRSRSESVAAEMARLRPVLAARSELEAAARARLEGARERLAATERESVALEAQEDVAARKRTEWSAEAGELGRRLETATREAEQSRRGRDENLVAREAAAREFELRAGESEARSAEAGAAEEAVRQQRGQFEASRQRRFDAEILSSRLNSDLDHLVEDTRREFGSPPSDLPAAPELAEDERESLRREAAELADQIERMGPVNVLAFEEHREQSERLGFLTAQRADLEASIASLLDTIRKINATSSERFAEAFARINEHFSELFQRLFRGGTAQMRLLDENDLLDSGIEITAQPPGKRNQSILLLSGGEKAMTAIALLMAIFRYKPSPFCILDEVDAPLDDANIERFGQLIREMSEDTQFITITHNKRTMEGADALYGVTMEEPGCSKLVSVQFD